jgi:predicted ABC-type ATPase
MSAITIISGPPGAGKTTVTKELICLNKGTLVYIEGDDFWKFMVNDGGRPVHKNFRATMSAMIGASIGYARNDYEVLLDFSIPPWYIIKAAEKLKQRKIALNYVVLLPTIDICATRAANREYGAIEYNERFIKFYESFGELQQYIVEENEADAKAIAERVKRGLDVGLFRF